MVIVLGIDPGTASTGYGVVLANGNRLAALDGGVIATDKREPLERRLARIHAGEKRRPEGVGRPAAARVPPARSRSRINSVAASPSNSGICTSIRIRSNF